MKLGAATKSDVICHNLFGHTGNGQALLVPAWQHFHDRTDPIVLRVMENLKSIIKSLLFT